MGKDSKPAGAEGAKDLAWAQQKYDEFIKDKDKFIKDELSKLEQLWKGTAVDSAETALARLLYARIQLQACFIDHVKLKERAKDIEACLQPLVEGSGIRSATALCLLAVWYVRILSYEPAEQAAARITALWEKFPAATDDLAGWRDPVEELLLRGKGSLFVDKDGAIGQDKAERIAALQKGFLDAPLKQAKDKSKAQPKLTKQQVEAAEKEAKSLATSNPAILQQRREREAALASCWKQFTGTIEDMDEGSKARIEKMLETVQCDRMDAFFDGMARALDLWTANSFGANSAYKQPYVERLAETIARFLGSRSLLALQRPDVGHALLGMPAKRTEEAGAAEASESKAAAGGGGGKGKGGKGGGGGGKGGGKADTTAATLQSAVEKLLAKDVDSPDVDTVLQDLEAQLKEHGGVLCTQLAQKALTALEVKESEEPLLKQLKERQDLGDLLVKAMHVKLGADGEAAGGSQSELDRIFAEVMLRQRTGEGLLWAADVEPLQKEHDTKTIRVLPRDLDAGARRRARFCIQLNALSALHRYDVLDSIALRFAIPATVDDTDEAPQKNPYVVSLPDAFDSPDAPDEVLQRLGDPLTIFTGYAHLLRQRGVLPLPLSGAKPGKGAGKAAAAALEGMDETGRRVARLCNSLLHATDGVPLEESMMVLHLQHTTKQEYFEVIRQVTGELPLQLAERLQAVKEGKPLPEVPEDAESDPMYGPFLEFDWRESLAPEAKKRLHAEWRDDIVTALQALEEGDCGLGRRLVATLKLFLADKCCTSPLELDVSSDRIGALLAKLTHQDLVRLRLFLLEHLGTRVAATPTQIRAAVAEWQRGVEEEMWGLELVTEGGAAHGGGAGKQGGKGGKGGDSGAAASAGAGIPRAKVRMSVKAYEALCRKNEERTRREELHKRTAVTLADQLKAAGKTIAPPAAAAAAAAATAGAAPTAAAAGTGSKKKGKGGGGGGAGGGDAAAAAAAPVDVDFASLVKDVRPLPMPSGADPKKAIDLLKAPYTDIVDLDNPAAVDALLKALALLETPIVVSTAEYSQMLERLLEGPAEGAALKLGTEKAESGALYELANLGTAPPTTAADMAEAPVFSLRDAVEELVRAVLLEELHKDVAAAARKQLEGLLAVWGSIVEHSPADREKLWELLEQRISPWARSRLRTMTSDVPTASWTGPEAAGKKLQEARREALKSSLTLQARLVRLSVLSAAVRQKDVEELSQRLLAKTRDLRTEPAKASKDEGASAAGGKGGKGGKARNTNNAAAEDASSSNKRLLESLEAEYNSVVADATWQRETNARARNLAERYMNCANSTHLLPGGLGTPPPDLSPAALADLMVDALEGLQVLMYHLTLLDSVIETVQVQARVAVGGALRNDLLSAGIAGTGVIHLYLDSALKDFVAVQTTHLLTKQADSERRKEEEKKRKEEEAKEAIRREKAEKEHRKKEEELQQKKEEERQERELKRKMEEELAEKKRKEKEQEIIFLPDDGEDDAKASSGDRSAGGKGAKAAQPPAAAAQQQAAGGGGTKSRLQEKLQQQGQQGGKQPPPLQQQPGAGKPGKENAGAPAPFAGKAAPAAAAPAGKEGREGPGKPAPPPPGPPSQQQQQQQQQQQAQGPQGHKGGQKYELIGAKDGKGAPPHGPQGGKSGPAQQHQHQHQQQPAGAGKSSVKGAQVPPAAAQGKAPPPPAPGKASPQPQAVPGFHHDEPAGGEGGRGRRRRGGGGGGRGGGSAAAGGVQVEPPSEQALEDRLYPFRYPYPYAPPRGWLVIEGFLLPDNASVQDFVRTAQETDLTDASVRQAFWLAAVDNVYNDTVAVDLPECPADVYAEHAERVGEKHDARRAAAQPQPPQPQPQQQQPHPQAGEGQQLPFAVPADLGQPVPAPPPGGMPYGAPGAHLNPYGPPGPLGPGFPPPPAPGILPPPMMPGMMQFRPPGMPPPPHFQPYAGGPMPPLGMAPPGMPPPGMGYPPRAMAPPLAAPAAEEEEEEDEDEDDGLLGLLGVASATPAPPKPAVMPVHVQPVISAAPGPYGAPVPPYGAAPGGYMPHMAAPAPSYVSAPPAAPAAPAPPAADAGGWGGSMADVAPASEKPAAPAATPKPLSWADKIKAAKKLEEMPEAERPAALPQPAYEDDGSDYDDDAHYQAAVAASLHDNKDVAFPALGAARPSAGRGAAGWGVGMGMAAAPTSDAATGGGNAAGTGLVNRQGEYNCFLNVIIQCLWHCTDFRAAMAPRRPEDYEAGHPVVAALLRLFKALDSADSHVHGGAAGERQVVDPSELRMALEGMGIRAGEMNDPSEVLSTVFESLNRAPGLAAPGPLPDMGAMQGDADMSRALSTVDRLFGLLLSEEVRCTAEGCGKTTHKLAPHIEYHVVVAAAALRETRMVLVVSDEVPESDMTTARILREIESQHTKRCDKDAPFHGCNRSTHVTRTLHNVPNVFSVLLAWEPDVQGDTIAETLQCVDTILQPTEIFMPGNCPHNLPSYALHGMFCYYGQHYFAFINRGGVEEADQEWVMFDDATVSTIGAWSAVIQKCRVGRIQPSVLFYQSFKAQLAYR
ncbi:hypothetical protein HXX76_000516 [Chlamydomonas incerta]|uniref:USP domain-containing protein n=1 Tax=Chlamydomonas incerta TaxID=51695 RepID=A0A836B304_CHLIN|nr:hypothetical protein HXX76_000516 [Chlamydomonas incerta]|eukprot:KAG2445913.1 hypothetical protein HXX76_000516 [Chlamydomonas incerta]